MLAFFPIGFRRTEVWAALGRFGSAALDCLLTQDPAQLTSLYEDQPYDYWLIGRPKVGVVLLQPFGVSKSGG